MGYIVVNISDLTKAIDGVLFLSCNILGLYKFMGIYRKRVSAAKLIAGLQNASIAGPKKSILRCRSEIEFLYANLQVAADLYIDCIQFECHCIELYRT